MASSIIHICVANEINKNIKKNNTDILIGSIAPDISKYIGKTKKESHFLDDVNNNIPNIDKFLNKYKNNLNDDFVLGYYIHLYTDYLWIKYFLPEFYNDEYIYKLDGSVKKISQEEKVKYIYNDYTNLNICLIDEYNLDLKIFYNEIPNFKNIIKEIPMNNINLIVEKAGLIIKNAKENETYYLFDKDIINKFINFSVDIILQDLKEKL